jgi:recombination protein RecT
MATLEDALPPTIPPKRFVSVLMTALQTKPDLLKCTFQSLWNACIRAAQDGLLPDGREGAIAPYGQNEKGSRVAEIATWMPMIAGYRKKIYEAKQVASWRVDVVYETDEFDFDLAEQRVLYHKRRLGTQAPGGVVGAYSAAKLNNGEPLLEVMSAYEIMQVRNKSKAGNGPWNDPAFFAEMCKKVVGRRHYKQLPHDESMDQMIARDDAEHGLLDPADTPPIPRQERRAIASHSVMDLYADGDGLTIDHDADTGEVQDNHDQVRGDAQKDDPITSGPQGAAGKAAEKDVAKAAPKDTEKNETAGGKPAASEGAAKGPASAAPSNDTRVAPSEASPGSDAGAAGSPQSEGDTGGSAAPDLSEDDPEPEPQAEQDGADRPWPPGTKPTDVPEYERYARSMLATFKAQADVPNWWNGEKELRIACGLKSGTDEFNRVRDMVAKRMNELA